jgi:hypothetical protein
MSQNASDGRMAPRVDATLRELVPVLRAREFPLYEWGVMARLVLL